MQIFFIYRTHCIILTTADSALHSPKEDIQFTVIYSKIAAAITAAVTSKKASNSREIVIKNVVAVKGPQVAVVFAWSGNEGLLGSGNSVGIMASRGRGVRFYGPSGCGKTLLVQALHDPPLCSSTVDVPPYLAKMTRHGFSGAGLTEICQRLQAGLRIRIHPDPDPAF